MDNLCHSLAGAALADAGLERRATYGMATLIIASNLPDIDVAVFATDTLPMSFRRGWTHGVLALVVLPLAFALLVRAFDRRSSLRGLLLLAYLGTWLHVFMDFLNSYGVRLLMPFSERWFYGDALYIVDPMLYVLLGGSLAVGRWRARRGADRGRWAGAGLALAGVYMLAMLGSNVWARQTVRAGLVRAGQSSDTRFMVTPVIGNPFRREVLMDMGARYEKGFLWFEPAPHFRPAGYGVDTNANNPLAERAAQTPVGRAYLRWSRFPFFVVKQTAPTVQVQLNDYRYAGPSGRDTWLSATVEWPTDVAPSGGSQ